MITYFEDFKISKYRFSLEQLECLTRIKGCDCYYLWKTLENSEYHKRIRQLVKIFYDDEECFQELCKAGWLEDGRK